MFNLVLDYKRGEEKSFIRDTRSSSVANDIVQFELSLMFPDKINVPRFIVLRMNKFVQSVLGGRLVATLQFIAAASLITSIMTGITIVTFSIASTVIGSSSRVLY